MVGAADESLLLHVGPVLVEVPVEDVGALGGLGEREPVAGAADLLPVDAVLPVRHVEAFHRVALRANQEGVVAARTGSFSVEWVDAHASGARARSAKKNGEGDERTHGTSWVWRAPIARRVPSFAAPKSNKRPANPVDFGAPPVTHPASRVARTRAIRTTREAKAPGRSPQSGWMRSPGQGGRGRSGRGRRSRRRCRA